MTDEKPEPMPYFGRDGEIVIPFASNKKYHWWAGGQSLSATIKEISAFGVSAPPPEDPEIVRRRQALVEQYQTWGRESLALRATETKGKGKRRKS
jgi:hypothetical protein